MKIANGGRMKMNKIVEDFISEKGCKSPWDFICEELYLKDFQLIVNYFEETNLHEKSAIGKHLHNDGFRFYFNYNSMELECTRFNIKGTIYIPFHLIKNDDEIEFHWNEIYHINEKR